MTEFECRQALERAGIGRLACAHDNQPYVVPIYFTLHHDHLYAFTTEGQKIEWMRANPRVCVEIDERIGHDRWQSVLVFGRYEELLDEPRYEAARVRALELLQKHPMWWEPAYVGPAHRETPHSEKPVCYRIQIEKITGRRATPNGEPAATPEAAKHTDGWWSEILRHIGLKD
jgi:nitroimidazol reductase NimA-like FMN-containing flavoprotein (pyridoxamine 5'-phosphate oxidase superfamily)